MTPPRADRLRNDGVILRAAARLLAHDPAASMQSVADAAGVSRLTVYRRYPDRDALVAALRTAVNAELDTALDGVPAWTSGNDTAATLIRALAGVAARYPIALLRYSPGTAPAPPADARIVGLLKDGQRAGMLRDDLGADILNAALFGVLAAVLATAPGVDTSADDSSDDDDSTARTVLALLLPCLTPPPRGSA
ncbi:MAG TPA: helix-turn-helix domain-containing protein [Mycobacteriales bacterium]|nr:helix-turn-helix domain-containing protein [Mycobacteriales bacterium]